MKDKISEGIVKGFSVKDLIDSISAGKCDDIEKYKKNFDTPNIWKNDSSTDYDIEALKSFLTEFLNSSNEEKRKVLSKEIIELLESILKKNK